MNRIPPPEDNGIDWLPGLPPAGTICDIRPVALRSDVWRNLLVLGYLANDPESRAVVRVPRVRVAGTCVRGTFGVEMRPIRTEWRPIPIPAYPEPAHA